MKDLRQRSIKRKNTKRGVVTVLMSFFAVWIVWNTTAISLTREENERFWELIDQGYSPEEAEEIKRKEFGIIVDSNPSTTPPAQTHTHAWKTEITKAATCTEQGEQTSTCTECGATTTKTIPKAEHTYTVVTQSGTCQETAKEVYTCAVCGYTYTKDGKKGEHDYLLTDIEPGNCLTPEKKIYTCSVCGDSYAEEGELGEHDYQLTSESEHDPCTESGEAVYICSICGDSYTETVEPLGHDLSTKKTVIKEAACTTEGKKAYICERCGVEVDPETIPATGHTPQYEVIKESGVFTTGNAHTVCTVCGEVLSEEELPATIPLWAVIAGGAGILLLVCLIAIPVVKKKKSA